MNSKILVKKVSHTDRDLNNLFDELDTELDKLYPEEDIFSLDVKKKPRNADKFYFLVAYSEAKPVACGCIKPLSKYSCELKRMFVKRGFRRQGIAASILEKLRTEAKRRGYRKILLETGPFQPEAINLYKKFGFEETGPFGRYKVIENSVFFVKNL